MKKIWQYKSKITSEPWITIPGTPTEEQLKDFKKYRYEVREVEEQENQIKKP